jgi:hypothetical protein
VENEQLLLYGTFGACTETSAGGNRQTNTCLKSITIHDEKTSIQLLAPNRISNAGFVLDSKVTNKVLGGVTIIHTSLGYIATVGNVTISWDGAVSFVFRVLCGAQTDGLLGAATCDEGTSDFLFLTSK